MGKAGPFAGCQSNRSGALEREHEGSYMRSRGVLLLVWIILASWSSAQTSPSGILTGKLTDGSERR